MTSEKPNIELAITAPGLLAFGVGGFGGSQLESEVASIILAASSYLILMALLRFRFREWGKDLHQNPEQTSYVVERYRKRRAAPFAFVAAALLFGPLSVVLESISLATISGLAAGMSVVWFWLMSDFGIKDATI